MNKVIVVDDTSMDQTFDMLVESYGEHPFVQLIRNEENFGVTGAKNIGFGASQADWVIFLDSDDTLLPERFEAACQVLKECFACPIVFFRCIDQDDCFVGREFKEGRNLTLHDYITHTSYGEALTAINKRLASFVPYDQDLRGYEGIGCLRLIKKFGPAFLSNIILRRYDQRCDSRLSSQKNMLLRAELLAKGHLRLYKEFSCDMSLGQCLNMLIKIAVYYSVSLPVKLFGTRRKT